MPFNKLYRWLCTIIAMMMGLPLVAGLLFFAYAVATSEKYGIPDYIFAVFLTGAAMLVTLMIFLIIRSIHD